MSYQSSDETDLELRVSFGNVGKDVGTIVGLVGGVFLGEQINDYVPQLQQAPIMIHLAVDVVSMYASSEVVGRIGQKAGEVLYSSLKVALYVGLRLFG